MGEFRQDRGKRFGGGQGSGFGGRDGRRKSWGGSGGRDRGPVTMHQAICDECGNSCEVPFRPTEGKPVYCNVCFGDKRKTGNERGGDRFPQENFNDRKTPAKNDFGSSVGKGNCDELKKQLEILNIKMDRIIKAVEGAKNINSAVIEEKKEKKKINKEMKTSPAVKAKKSAKKTFKKIKK
jgi:CxxC-x17-CxxC domain-containing protein